MNSLLLALLLSCGPDAKGNDACGCGHEKKAGAPAGDSACGQATKGTGEGSCGHAGAHAATPAAAGTANATATGPVARGEKLVGLPSVTLAKLLAAPSDFDGKTVAVEAKVRKACEKMGCWMELGTGEGPGVRVTFKNSGFFVPLDSAGRTAKVEGTIKLAELTPERAKHFESEGARVPKGKDGKYREVQLVASGVELLK
jgi:hypothetical protein